MRVCKVTSKAVSDPLELREELRFVHCASGKCFNNFKDNFEHLQRTDLKFLRDVEDILVRDMQYFPPFKMPEVLKQFYPSQAQGPTPEEEEEKDPCCCGFWVFLGRVPLIAFLMPPFYVILVILMVIVSINWIQEKCSGESAQKDKEEEEQ